MFLKIYFQIYFFFLLFPLISSTIECAPSLFKAFKLRHLSLYLNKTNYQEYKDYSYQNRRVSSSSTSTNDPDHDTEGPQVLYFFCIGLLLGSITSFILPRLKSKIPYTVVMFVEGMIAAVIYMHFDQRILSSFFLSFFLSSSFVIN